MQFLYENTTAAQSRHSVAL